MFSDEGRLRIYERCVVEGPSESRPGHTAEYNKRGVPSLDTLASLTCQLTDGDNPVITILNADRLGRGGGLSSLSCSDLGDFRANCTTSRCPMKSEPSVGKKKRESIGEAC